MLEPSNQHLSLEDVLEGRLPRFDTHCAYRSVYRDGRLDGGYMSAEHAIRRRGLTKSLQHPDCKGQPQADIRASDTRVRKTQKVRSVMLFRQTVTSSACIFDEGSRFCVLDIKAWQNLLLSSFGFCKSVLV